MPVATELPSRNVVLRFPPTTTYTVVVDKYQLLELPPEIMRTIEAHGSSSSTPYPLTIKGKPSDDAVLCTPDSTFALRTVNVSNSLLVCRAPEEPSGSPWLKRKLGTLEIRDACHQIIELQPSAPNLERLRGLLRPSAWRGPGEGEERDVRRYTRGQLESVVQASDKELEVGLRERNIIELNGKMLLLPVDKLRPVLSIVFTVLSIHCAPPGDGAQSTAMIDSAIVVGELQDHDITPAFSRELMGLFGKVDGPRWEADLGRMVTEVGKGLLVVVSHRGRPVNEFMQEWREAVGEAYAELVDLKLLEGEHLVNAPPSGSLSPPLIVSFPVHALPLHPATRFADLFLTRPRWRPEEITPFLRGLMRDGDTKERDKLVAKFVRVVREKEGTWWYPRRTT